MIRALVSATLMAAMASCTAAPPPPAATSAARQGDFDSLLNAARQANGLPAITPDRRLAAAARAHAQDMSARRYFSHQGADGSTLPDRVHRQGYGFCTAAENIAQGQRDEAAVMQGWMQSPGHRRNMLNPAHRQYGLARAPGDYWVLVLGSSGC